ncbi:MAG: hypothetical protein ABI743_14530, partial [bacterium]
MWKWLPPGWRVPIATKITLLLLLTLVPLLTVSWLSSSKGRQLTFDLQRSRLQDTALGLATFVGNTAR